MSAVAAAQAVAQPRKLHMIFKLFICMGLTGGYLAYRLAYIRIIVNCIHDTYLEATYNANRWMYNGADNAILGIGQVLTDLWILILGIIWIIKIRNFRVLVAYAVFFVVRGVIFLNVEQFPFPEDMVWHSPGFYSFTVAYDHTRDFFYSGHTGTFTTLFFEFILIDYKIVAGLAFISLVYVMNMLIISRVHYTCDIMGGLIFAIWFHKTATRNTYYIDKLFSIPFVIGKWIYQKCKQKCTCCTCCKNEQENKDPTVDNNKPQTPQLDDRIPNNNPNPNNDDHFNGGSSKGLNGLMQEPIFIQNRTQNKSQQNGQSK